jgi:hypothetical protein
MTRVQFWILIAGSSLVVFFLLLHVIFGHMAENAAVRVQFAQQVVAAGRSRDADLRQLATRVYQVSAQSQDQGLKDLLTRQHVTINQTPAAAPSGAAPTR